MKQKRVLIMAGGTGGHVFPALTIAKALQQLGTEVQWLGTPDGIEARLVPEANIPLQFITIGGVRGKGLLKKLLSPLKIIRATLQAVKIIHRFKPDAVLGLGGFASGPGGVATFLLGRPLLIHEQNAIAGMTNQLLSRVAKIVMEAFPHTFPASMHPVLTGNPVREAILALPTPDIRFQQRKGSLHILVLGGSGGALTINQIVPEAIKLLPLGFCEVWHQTGALYYDVTQKNYTAGQTSAKVEPFINDMAAAYEWADVVICRAGALTIAELAAAGVGSILIPYPFAVDDHQTVNAQYLVNNQAATLLPQPQLQAKNLASILQPLTRNTLLDQAKQAYQLRLPHATKLVVEQITNSIYPKY